MGCAASSSRVRKHETVAACSQRKKHLKRALQCRQELAMWHAEYLLALRNAGLALVQLAELDVACSAVAPPPPPLNARHRRRRRPPPPPPPPPLSVTPSPSMSPSPSFSVARRRRHSSADADIDIPRAAPVPAARLSAASGDSGHGMSGATGPPLAVSDTETASRMSAADVENARAMAAWDFWYPLWEGRASSMSQQPGRASRSSVEYYCSARPSRVQLDLVEEQQLQWHEAACEFLDDDVDDKTADLAPPSSCFWDSDDDTTSMLSWYSNSNTNTNTRGSDMVAVCREASRSLVEIVRDVDEYFLKASNGGRDVSRLLQTCKVSVLHARHRHSKSKNNGNSSIALGIGSQRYGHSAKIFSSFSWSRSSKSPRPHGYALEKHKNNEQSSHGSTLERLYALERTLYEELRDRESAKMLYRKKFARLRRHESRGRDERKIQRARESVRKLELQIMEATNSANTILACILNVRDNDLYHQLRELSQGLVKMWRCMYECHHVQYNIVKQNMQLDNLPAAEATSDHNHQATIQLREEVTTWYKTFCNLIKCQRSYIHSLTRWMNLSIIHMDHDHIDDSTSKTGLPLCAWMDDLQQALDRLPDKAASEAIHGFVNIVHAMVLQQAEEQRHKKKVETVAKKLAKKIGSLQIAEKKQSGISRFQISEKKQCDISRFEYKSGSNYRDPLAKRKAKIDLYRRKLDDEKAKHLKAIRASRAMTLHNLQTGLPNVFLAMTSFSSVCMQACESVNRNKESFRFDVVAATS